MDLYNLTQQGSVVQALLNKIAALPANAELQQALTTLQGNIDTEATTRGNADTAIQAQVTLAADVVPQAIAELYAAVIGLAQNLRDLGVTKADTIDFANMPKVCGEPLVVKGEGAPAIVPMFVGQRYHDTTNSKVYEAMSVTNSTSDWVLLN